MGEAALLPAIQMRVPKSTHGALVLGRTGFDGRVYSGASIKKIDAVVEAGEHVGRTERMGQTSVQREIYDRNVRAFGSAGQQTLRSLKAAVVGLGGTGSLVAQQLAHLGIGSVLLIDHDQLETSNLNRVAGANSSDVGRLKVDVARDHIRRIGGGATKVSTLGEDVVTSRTGSKLLNCDVVFGCTDSHGSRAVINQLAYQHFLPAIDMGVRIDASDGVIQAMAGRVQMLCPGLPCLQCGSVLNSEAVRRELLSPEARRLDPYIVGEPEPQPAVISLNGTVASLAVTMFLSAFVGVPIHGRHLVYRVGKNEVRPVGGQSNPNCVVCSAVAGSFGQGSKWPMIWRV